VIDESDLQDEKQFDPRISTLHFVARRTYCSHSRGLSAIVE
jgi:hypothetical protein